MKSSVDFLPTGYRAQRRRRGIPWSIFLVAAIAGIGVFGAVAGQFVYARSIDAQMQAALEQKAVVDADLVRLAELRAERDRLEALARRTYYTHRPTDAPKFFVELGRSLPQNCRMLEVVRTNAERAQTPTYAPPVPFATQPGAAETATSAIDRDREQLRRASAFADSETWLAAGVSTDVASLHQFVASLERSPLGLSAQLTSFEADRSQPGTVRFSVTIERRRSRPATETTARNDAQRIVPVSRTASSVVVPPTLISHTTEGGR